MANTPQAKKRIKRNANRAEINGARIGRIRTFVKKVEAAIEGGDKASAADALKVAQPEMAKGVAKGAPYDLILVDGATEEVPAAVSKQLAPGGRFAGAINDRGVTRLVVGTAANGAIGLRSIVDADVVVWQAPDRVTLFAHVVLGEHLPVETENKPGHARTCVCR